jgi:hypothetical protein
MSAWARFWAVDFHVHTPGSADAELKNYGTPAEIVQTAIDRGLDAIVIADHNTAGWCDRMAEAAQGTELIVLPGVEISTTEGHLLGIWEQGTPSAVIHDLLIRLGIPRHSFGKLDIATERGFTEAAEEIVQAGGIAVPAHVDKDRGLLKLDVKARVKTILADPSIAAVEIFHEATQADINRKTEPDRLLACVRGSDTFDPVLSTHALSGLGDRRTWIKAARPDLVGIRHAFADPELRILLSEPPALIHPVIERVWIVGGFLDEQVFDLSPDLNCLLGGTGAGKSLVLETVRYCVDQQVDRDAFPAIRAEVDSRLKFAFTSTGVVRIQVVREGKRFRIERPYCDDGTIRPVVSQQVADQWLVVDESPVELLPLAAFSQGEVLEYARQPVVRMSLVDAGLDLSRLDGEIAGIEQTLRHNGEALIAADAAVERLADEQTKVFELTSQIETLSGLFTKELVQEQEHWQQEDGQLKRAARKVAALEVPQLAISGNDPTHRVDANKTLFDQAASVLQGLNKRTKAASDDMTAAIEDATKELSALQVQWRSGFEAFTARLNDELDKVEPDSSLKALRAKLAGLQSELAAAQQAGVELTQNAKPLLDQVEAEREKLLAELSSLRKRRRELRRKRVVALNKNMAGFVKLDVPDGGDRSAYMEALKVLKVGSHVREQVLEAIAASTHPMSFVRSMWKQDTTALVNTKAGIDAANLARLLTNILDRDLWADLLAIQEIDCPDVLTVKFKKPDDGSYTPIENLAHGQKCTAILVILLADGTTPIVVDQPEDALHAPWIEEYLVPRLRALRGTRQYLFATRSPSIVISADAEQIITMKATSGRGEAEKTGSLERHDLNERVVYHVEGGPIPFRRRSSKLNV